jgi:Fe-S cluster biosynthesis and repair protein YggX
MTQLVPSLLSAEDQQNIIKELAFLIRTLGYNVPDNIIKKIAFRNYIKSGTNLVKKSLSMGDRYEIVLEKIFPEGIRVYNGEDMRLFRKGYSDLFNDNRISKNDHAIAARVIDRCILIDRGTYILNKRIEFPEELSKRIFDYIMKYPFDMVMTNAIMNRFNEELTAIEVNNKYCLVSVLKQHFSDNFCFRRDYVIKGEYTGNIYGNITSYVESHHDGVSIYDINVGFEGIPDAVIYFALSEDDSIIPMYNKMYIHKSNISFPEQLQVLAFLQKTINHEHIISDERVYVTIKKNFPNFIANNNINTSWFLFSILRSFFSYEFKFSRPHIIDSTFDSANGREALRESFWGKKYVDIADIKNYAKEKQIQIYDWSKLLDSYNDKYFIYDKERLIRIDESGYKPEDFVCIEKIILEALGALEYCEISKLNMLNSLPKLKVELTDWIIYSIINKYGTKISAITSTPQFLNSVPIVFRNSIGIETIRDYYASSDTADQTVKIDDLTDVDSLVEGLIDPDSVLFEGEV